MKHTDLQVTYREGRALAAYLYLPRRSGDRSARVEQAPGGLVIDFTEDGHALGIEITSPASFELGALNAALEHLGLDPLTPEDVRPLVVA